MKRLLLAAAQVGLLAAGPPVTLEWVLGPEAKAITTLPRTAWLGDGTLLVEHLGDGRLERLDPATGVRLPALDEAKALDGLKALLGPDAPGKVSWPEGLDQKGRKALVKEGEAFLVLDLPSATWQRLPRASSALLAPDGSRAAFVRDHDLYVVDLATRAETRITRDGSETVQNGSFSWVYWEELYGHREEAYWWSPDSRNLAFLRSDEAAVPLHSFTDFEPFQARVLTQRYPQAGQANPKVRLGLASSTGAVAWLDLAPEAYEYLAQVTWLPDGGRVAVQTLNRAQDTLDLFLADAATGRTSRLLEERSAAGVHSYAPLFLKDGRHFLWVSDRTGYNHVYRYTLDGRLVNPVTRGEWSLAPWGDDNGDTGLLGVDEKAGLVAFTCQASGSVERQVWQAGLDGAGLKRLSAEPGRHDAVLSPDFRFYVDAWSSVDRPPSLTLRRMDGGAATVLAEPRAGLDLPCPSLFTIPAADGLPLPARLSKPKDFDPSRRHPVIFYVYGGPGVPSVEDRWGGGGMPFEQALLAAGYVVVSVDNRCSAAIGRKYEAANRGRLLGDVELQDLLAGVRWVKAQPWADPARVGIWGWSGGGTSTLAALTRTGEFKAGIAVAPVTDWHYYDSFYTELVMGRPEDNPEGYLATSLVASAKNLHGRLLLMYGTHDDNVHPQNSEAFADALIAAGITFDTMVYPMRKHGIGDPAARLHLFRTMLEFWKRNL